jgi:hypothetical protein
MGPITTARAAILEIEKTVEYKEIKPHWGLFNGVRLQVERITVVSIADNLKTRVVFKYILSGGDGIQAGEGVYALNETNYSTWDASEDGAYQIVCAAIGVELV